MMPQQKDANCEGRLGGKKGKERQREESIRMRRWGENDRKWHGDSSPNCKGDC